MVLPVKDFLYPYLDVIKLYGVVKILLLPAVDAVTTTRGEPSANTVMLQEATLPTPGAGVEYEPPGAV
jgi:hypothetical protein